MDLFQFYILLLEKKVTLLNVHLVEWEENEGGLGLRFCILMKILSVLSKINKTIKINS